MIKKREGPIFRGDKAYISERLFNILGGDLKKATAKEGDVISLQGERYLSTNLLKRCAPDKVYDVVKFKDRKALYIVLQGDQNWLFLLFLPYEISYDSLSPQEKEKYERQRSKVLKQWMGNGIHIRPELMDMQGGDREEIGTG